MRRAVFALVVVAAVSGRATANGRFPSTMSASWQQGGGDDLLIGATFGVVYSTDGGANYKWICEQAVGYGGFFDPQVAENSDGVLFATTFDGLARSEDGGCTWGYSQGALYGLWIDGLTLHPTNPNILFVATSSGGQMNGIFKSTDSGRSFTLVPGTLSATEFFKSVVIAPGDPMRLYATSYTASPMTTSLWKSTDGGASFGKIAFAPGGTAEAKELAIDASNPDILYVRTAGPPPSGGGEAPFLVYRSENGGTSFTQVFSTQEIVGAVAGSPNGQTVGIAIRPVPGVGVGGLYRSTDGGRNFAKVPPPAGSAAAAQITCAQMHGSELTGCANNYSDMFAFGRSTDFGDHWSKLFAFTDLKGPPNCPAGAVATWLPEPTSTDPKKASRATKELCEPLWFMTGRQIGAIQGDSGSVNMDASARADGSTSGGGAGPCGCRVGTSGTSGRAAVGLALVIMLLALLRRRRALPVLAFALLVVRCGGGGGGSEAVIYQGNASDEAYMSFVNAQAQQKVVVNDAKAPVVSVPSQNQEYQPSDAPPPFRWSNPLSAGVAPQPRPNPRAPVPSLMDLLRPGERAAWAHLPPVTGPVFLVRFTLPGRSQPLLILTTNTSYTPDATEWGALKGVDGDIRIEIQGAYLRANLIEDGPYVASTPRTFHIAKSIW